MSFLKSLFTVNKKFLPASTYFDHLNSEYKAIESLVTKVEDKKLLEDIRTKRNSESLRREDKFSWDDIYTFELILLEYLPLEILRNKVIALRAAHLNIFGQDKYETYLKSNPLDPAQAEEKDKERLRADARYLLNQSALALAALSSREGLGKRLTIWAAYLIIIAIGVTVLLFLFRKLGVSGSPIKVAFIAGSMGGLLSILHRLQAIPSTGDPIYSLATFWHGAYALFVSPLTGAIFAILLYLMFAGGILEGRFFPQIATPKGADTGEMCGEMTIVKSPATPTPTPSPAETATRNSSNTANTANTTNTSNTANTANRATTANTSNTANTANSSSTANTTNSSNTSNTANFSNTTNTANSSNTANTANSASNANTANTSSRANASNTTNTSNTANTNSSTTTTTPTAGSTTFNRFLDCSGPASGFDYALLIIWCFLAGFAERLVPDTLNRLVEESGQVKIKKT